MSGYQTPREIVTAANAVENWITMVDEQFRLVFKPKPTSPVAACGARSGMTFQDASSNSLSEIYNHVVVTGSGPDGSQLAVERSSGQQPGAMLLRVTSPSPDNPSFDTNATSWTASGGGTIARQTSSFDTAPASGLWTPSAGSQTLTTTFTGTFRKGRTYVLMFAVTNYTGVAAWDVSVALGQGSDVAQATVTAFPSGFAAYSVAWIPSADRSAATFVLTNPKSLALGVDSLQLSQVFATLVDRQGYRSSFILQVDTGLTAALGQQFGDLFLKSHKTSPFKGQATITGQRSVWDARTGAGIHPGLLGKYVNQLIRFEDRLDPDTGGVGRDGTIAAVEYDHNTCTAKVDIDDTRSNFEALLARYAVVVGAGQ